jgi:hypothetical protein
MRLNWATVGILLGLALILSACGEDGTTAADRPAGTINTTPSVPPHATISRSSCRQLRPFVGSMVKLRDDLARGLSYDDYLHEVQGVRLVYARIDADRLSAGCLLAAGGAAERALNLYIDATNTWGDCLATVSCNTHSIEPRLQRGWALSAHQLTSAQQGLRGA